MLLKVARIAYLFDIYGNLLTEKQRNIISSYYEEDLSLSEIAENSQISRQAVYDVIKRAEATLEEYENKLGILKNHLQEEELLRNLLKLVEDIETGNISSTKEAKKIIKDIMFIHDIE